MTLALGFSLEIGIEVFMNTLSVFSDKSTPTATGLCFCEVFIYTLLGKCKIGNYYI